MMTFSGCDAIPISDFKPVKFSSLLLLDRISGDVEVLEERVKRAYRRILEYSSINGGWHENSAISSLNIIAALYGYWVPRGVESGVERLVILSKGHCSLALYSWYVELGLIGEQEFEEFGKLSSKLQTHPEAGKTPGTLVSTGSLGQGLSVANGIVIASRLSRVKREVAVILGDGELNEGQIWEAISTTSSLGLREIIAVVDRNWTQHTGQTELIKPLEPLREKWEAFGWKTLEVSTNNVKSIIESLREAEDRDSPLAIIVNTSSKTY